MRLYTNATIKIVEENHFTDQNGKPVDYFTNYIKSDDNEVLEVNSTTDYSAHEGETGIATINATKRETGGGFKLSLKDFREGETVDIEDTIN